MLEELLYKLDDNCIIPEKYSDMENYWVRGIYTADKDIIEYHENYG